LTLTNDEIVDYLQSLEKESKALTKHIYNLAWHMRGGITLDEAFGISYAEREIINELINERIEVTNETKLPYF
jgi:hypothetical protein